MQQALAQQEMGKARGLSLMSSWGRPLGADEGRNQEELARQFEDMRQQVIGAMEPEARDWIGMWKAKNVPNPFRSQPQTSDESYQGLQEYGDRIKDAADRVRKRMNDSDDPLTTSGVLTGWSTEEQAARATLIAEKEVNKQLTGVAEERALGSSWAKAGEQYPMGGASPAAEAGFWATPRTAPGGEGTVVGEPSMPREPLPTMPEIPLWLQRASGLTGRVPETRQPITTPSGQSWMRLNPTQKSMYAGLADWAGERTFSDIMWEMQRQLPKAPTRPRGWRAYAQR